jgi:hypothetical protein
VLGPRYNSVIGSMRRYRVVTRFAALTTPLIVAAPASAGTVVAADAFLNTIALPRVPLAADSRQVDAADRLGHRFNCASGFARWPAPAEVDSSE